MTEQKRTAFLKQILEAIYSPRKAFKDIAQAPKYLGPILIMVLFIVAYTASAYAFFSKTYSEQVLPQASRGDEWTENSTSLWTSNALITESTDCIGTGYYGNKSVQFSAANETNVWMQLTGIGQVNCSSLDGYKNISLRIKVANPEEIKPENATMYLFSSDTDFFQHELTEIVLPSNSSVWSNLTITLGPQTGWVSGTPSADWSNIVSLKLEFFWQQNVSSEIRLDGLFFRGVFLPSEGSSLAYVYTFSSNALMQFFVQWILLTGLIFLLVRGFHSKIAWRSTLIMIGFALVTLVVQTLFNTVVYSSVFPELRYPFELLAGMEQESQMALAQILEQTWFATQFLNVFQLIVSVWTIALCSIATRVLTEFSWTKSALIASAGYTIVFLIQRLFLFPY